MGFIYATTSPMVAQNVDPFFICNENSSGGVGGGTFAKDALGNDVIAAQWLKTHGPGDRTLTQGLKVNQNLMF